MSESDGVFPLLDRRAPVIERIRQRREADEGEGLGMMVARLQNASSVAEAEAEIARFTESFTETVAEQLDVNEGDLSEEAVENLNDTLREFYTEGVLDITGEEDVFDSLDEATEEVEEAEDDSDGGEDGEGGPDPEDLTDEDVFE